MKRAIVWAVLGILPMANLAKGAELRGTQTINTMAAASNLFAVDLYAQVREASGNICISPYSVSSALGMTAAGAAGKTAEQMLSVLHWTGQPADLSSANAALNAAIVHLKTAPTNRDPQITIANALFGQRGFPYRKHFLDLLANQYGAALQDVDFTAQPQQACDQINHWAAEKTHDRIKQAVPVSAITLQTRMILVGAIYFKAAWEDEFPKSYTANRPFFPIGKDSMNVPTMQEKRSFQYMGNDQLQIAELPYNGDFSMLILLPRQRDGLPALEKSLTGDALNGWLSQLSPELLQVYLPRFRVEGEYQLTGNLQKMGMTDAFNANTADFSGIVSSGKLSIDQVIHKTFISVDEEGTEAAAVTSITMRATAMRQHTPQPEPIIFQADHPFLFVLRHRSTGALLFIGRISNPQ